MGWVVNVTPRPRFTPWEMTPGIHWIGGCVGPRAGLDTGYRKNLTASAGDWTTITPSSSPYSNTKLTELPWLLLDIGTATVLRSFLWKGKIHYRVHKIQRPVPILSQINPKHMPQSYFSTIHFSIILLSTSKSSERSLYFRFSKRNFVSISHFCLRGTCLLYIWWKIQSTKLLIVHFPHLPPLHPS
jgi:hypothetical protein